MQRKQKITKSLSSDYKVGYQNKPHTPGFIVLMVISGLGLVCEAKRLDLKQQQQIKMAASQNTPVVYDGPVVLLVMGSFIEFLLEYITESKLDLLS